MMKNVYNKGNTDWYSDAFKKFEEQLNGQTTSKVHQYRKEAIKSFQDLGYPTTRHEEWKYTNVLPLVDQNFKISKPYKPGSISKDKINPYQFSGLEDRILVFINGHFASELSDLSGIKENIEVLSL